MPSRVICPACGKLNRVSDHAAAGSAVVCLACGARIPASLLVAEPAPATVHASPAPDIEEDDIQYVTDVPAPASVTAPSNRPKPSRTPVAKVAIVAAASLLVGGVIGASAML